MHSTKIPSLAEAAAALVAIDAAGQLPGLNDEIIYVRREWHKNHLKRAIGENIYIDRLAKYLQAEGIDAAEAWNAVRDAVRPSWSATLLQTIVEFAERLAVAERRSA
jgi:hypothetical protein